MYSIIEYKVGRYIILNIATRVQTRCNKRKLILYCYYNYNSSFGRAFKGFMQGNSLYVTEFGDSTFAKQVGCRD